MTFLLNKDSWKEGKQKSIVVSTKILGIITVFYIDNNNNNTSFETQISIYKNKNILKDRVTLMTEWGNDCWKFSFILHE